MNASKSIHLALPRFVFRNALLNLIGPILPQLKEDQTTQTYGVNQFLDVDLSQVKFIDDAAVLLFLAIEHKLLHLGYDINARECPQIAGGHDDLELNFFWRVHRKS
jgi:ABC-type transporter Mla MlaB component